MTVIGNRIGPAFGDEEPNPAASSNNGGEGKSGRQGEKDAAQTTETSPR